MTRASSPGRNNPAARERVRGLVAKDVRGELTAKAIHKMVEGDFQIGLSTVEDIVREARRDLSGPWSFAGDQTGNPRAVLTVLQSIAEVSRWDRATVTVAEAELIARVSQAAPELEPFDICRLARLYRIRAEGGDAVADLDALLAFAPFRGKREYKAYQLALSEGRITALPDHLADLAEPMISDPDAIDQAIREGLD